MTNISLVTRHMDRLEHLQRTLPTWVKVTDYKSIIIVDWSSKKDDILPYIREINDPRVVVLQVKDQEFFDRGKSWNLGIRYCKTELVNLIDCDIMIEKVDFSSMDIKMGEFYPCTTDIDIKGFLTDNIPGTQSTTGSCLIWKEQWEAVGGFFEKFIGWGIEDMNFYDRLWKHGYKAKQLQGIFHHIPHSDDKRFGNEKHQINCATVNKSIARKLKQTKMEPILTTVHIGFHVEEKVI